MLIVEDWAEIRRLGGRRCIDLGDCARSGLLEADQAVSVLNQASSTSDKRRVVGAGERLLLIKSDKPRSAIRVYPVGNLAWL